MSASRSGMALMELIAAMAVIGLLMTAGMGGLGSLGEAYLRQGQARAEASRLEGLRDRLQRAWEAREGHRWQGHSWLMVEGNPSADGVSLRHWRMRFVQAEGEAAWWDLRWTADGWVEQVEPLDAASSGPLSRLLLAYSGEILLDMPPGQWAPGLVPEKICWRFPDARSTEGQLGFTLINRWP